jgi:endonuclease/exonuclease/phosphatase family metal-dependent hydrolase
MSRCSSSLLALTLLASLGACSKQAPPPKPPVAAAPAPAPEPAPEPEPEPPKVPEDAFAIGTFNVEWAFDDLGDGRPKKAQPHVPQKSEDWAWKRDQIAQILVAEKLDIVVLVEVGGERELADIVSAVREKGGHDYDFAWMESTDRVTGQQVAILSRFSISNARRYPVAIEQHVAADVELPTGDTITVLAMQLREGHQPAYASKRRKAARALKQKLKKEQSERPIILLGTFNSLSKTFDDDYAKRTPGILAGKNTSTEADDCADSASEAASTNTKMEPLDRILVCGLELRRAEISGEDAIVRDDEDPPDAPWPAVPIAEHPHRDVSDHYVLWAEVALPKKPEPEKTEGEGEAGAAAPSP